MYLIKNKKECNTVIKEHYREKTNVPQKQSVWPEDKGEAVLNNTISNITLDSLDSSPLNDGLTLDSVDWQYLQDYTVSLADQIIVVTHIADFTGFRFFFLVQFPLFEGLLKSTIL